MLRDCGVKELIIRGRIVALKSCLIAKLEVSPKYYQKPFDNTSQRLKSEKHSKSEMKGAIIHRKTKAQINSHLKIRPRWTDYPPCILSYHS